VLFSVKNSFYELVCYIVWRVMK